MNFEYKYEKLRFGIYRINIFHDDKLYGVISQSDLDGVSNINNRLFYLDDKKANVVVDARTNKKICELAHYSDGSHHIEIENKSKYLLRKGYTFNENQVCVENIDSKNKKYNLSILSESDIELILYSYFYFKIPTD